MAICEADLIEDAVHGDQEAFRHLWEAHHTATMAAALRLCHHRALAKEITQGAFLLRNYAIAHFLIGSLVPLPWLVLILFLLHGLSIAIFPIAISLCIALNAVALWRLHVQGQWLAFRADSLVVLWLGRGTACRGLHALADLSPTPHRRRWGEPSLVERIERVCGARVETQDDRVLLTR